MKRIQKPNKKWKIKFKSIDKTVHSFLSSTPVNAVGDTRSANNMEVYAISLLKFPCSCTDGNQTTNVENCLFPPFSFTRQ